MPGRVSHAPVPIYVFPTPGSPRIPIQALPYNVTMHICTAKVILRLPENDNLKGKRQVVKSVTARLRERFNIAVAEVGTNDEWQIVTLGICCVSNDTRHANSQISNAMEYLEKITAGLELLDYQVEILDGP